MDQTHVRTASSCDLQGDIEIHDLKLMVDEGTTGLAVLAAPLDIGEVDAIALDQEPRPAVGQRINHRGGARVGIIIELGAGTVEIAGMKQPCEAIVAAVARSIDQSCDVAGSQKAMA